MNSSIMYVKAEDFRVNLPEIHKFNPEYDTPSFIPSHYEISCECEVSTNDDMYRTLFSENKYDITITDRKDNSVTLYDQSISYRLKVTKRIPRKMKKVLKKRHGDLWLHYHPNTVSEVTFSRA